MSKRNCFENQHLSVFVIDKAFKKSTEHGNIVQFVHSRNPELSLLVSDDLSDYTLSQVEGYFKKVEKRISHKDLVSFTNFNSICGRFPKFPEVSWSTD